MNSLQEESDPDDTVLAPVRLIVRLAPMVAIAWTRAYAVVLPDLMETFELSPAEGGRFVATVEGGSFLSLLVLGLVVERIGVPRVLLVGLPVIALTLLMTTFSSSLLLLTPVLLLLGSGMAWTATGINTLMASTGRHRSFYLGVMHATFSAFSALAPVIAGWVLHWSSWQVWYRTIACMAACFALLLWNFEMRAAVTGSTRREHEASPANRGRGHLRRIGTICAGVFFLATVQGVFNAWSYLYIENVYQAKATLATFAPACFWVGIFGGRSGLIGLARMYSARTLLIGCSLVPGVAVVLERIWPSPWLALAVMLLAGAGVAGTFQLGTQWAAERIPQRVGTASTAVMACAWLGVGMSPWAAGVVIELTSFEWLIAMTLGGSLLAWLFFSLTPRE